MPDYFTMDDVNCDGSENTLWDCHHEKLDNCNYREGAGVVGSDPFSKCIFRSRRTV